MSFSILKRIEGIATCGEPSPPPVKLPPTFSILKRIEGIATLIVSPLLQTDATFSILKRIEGIATIKALEVLAK